jgi:hypothetical protein
MILAFAGRKQSGKSTSAEYVQSIVNSHNLRLSNKIYSFADPLKQDICINILGLTYEQCYGSDEHKNTLTDIRWQDMPDYNESFEMSGYMSARQIMEHVGTNVFRKIKTNVWVDATINKIKKENLDLAIIADCRFPNEVESIKKAGGYVIRLDLDPFGSDSNSENALDKDKYDWNKFDLVIRNTGMTIDEKNNIVLRFLSDKGILSL